jgi:anti-sigma regulatory factor (Ser/Thr protein kinase)
MRHTYRLSPRIDAIDDVAWSVVSHMSLGRREASVHAAVSEALMNAVVYGALGVPSTDVRNVLDFVEAIAAAEQRGDAEDVVVTVEPSAAHTVRVTVRDPGRGFDTRTASRSKVVPLATRGRGVPIMRATAESLAWNDSGNEITLEFRTEATSAQRRTA